MTSLIQSLNHINQPLPFSLPSRFQSHPGSLKEMIRIMNLPNPNLDTLQRRMVHDFSEENAQGIAYAYGNIWFLSSEHKIFKYRIDGADLYHPSGFTRLATKKLQQIIGACTGLDNDEFDHIGDMQYFGSLLFAPIRSRNAGSRGHLLVALTDNLDVVAYARFGLRTNDAWCAVNPWNRYLYASPNNRDNILHAYDISAFFSAFNTPGNWGNPVNMVSDTSKQFNFYKPDGSTEQVKSIQGGAFSPNGRMYIARYDGDGPTWDNYLHVYSSLTGKKLDSKYYNFPGVGDEIEGLTIHPSGVIYIVVADNDWPSTDEFELHAFKYSDPSFPV